MVKVATAPVPPVLPHAPQVSQSGESSTLLSTVVLLGFPDGVGEGEAAGVGEGDAETIGGVDGLPPQPIASISQNKETTHALTEEERGQLRTLGPPHADLLPSPRCANCIKWASKWDYVIHPSSLFKFLDYHWAVTFRIDMAGWTQMAIYHRDVALENAPKSISETKVTC